MVAGLAFLFLVVPFAELYVLLVVGRSIGVFETIGLLVLVSVVGAWLVKREGGHGSSALRVLSATGAHPMGPLPHGTLPIAATRCATPLARRVDGTSLSAGALS